MSYLCWYLSISHCCDRSVSVQALNSSCLLIKGRASKLSDLQAHSVAWCRVPWKANTGSIGLEPHSSVIRRETRPGTPSVIKLSTVLGEQLRGVPSCVVEPAPTTDRCRCTLNGSLLSLHTSPLADHTHILGASVSIGGSVHGLGLGV